MQYLSEIICGVIGAISGSLLTITYTKISASRGGRNINQSRSTVKGDQIAGNKTTTSRK